MSYENINLSKSKIFLICCLVFIFGIAVASFLPLGLIQSDLSWFAGIAAGAAVLILFWKNKIIRIAALAGLFLFLGIWRYSVGLPKNTPDKIWHYNGQVVTVIGTVSNEPDVRRKNVKYTVETQDFASLQHGYRDNTVETRSNASLRVNGKILITANLYPRYSYGDELKISCELKKPEPFNGFSYDRYLARYDVYSICYYPKIELLNSGKGNWLYENIFKIKNKFRGIIDYGLSEPESSLARAIILGDKKGIPDDLRDKFSKTGISHIMAISGMHISILAGLFMIILLGAGLWRKHAFYFSAVFLFIYIMLIGLPASAMRAGLMGFLVLWALNLGRLNKLVNSLVLAAAILLFINPKLLRGDIGFQLSFLAVLGISLVYPALKKRLPELPRQLGSFGEIIRDMFIITIAAQIFTLPIIALNFSQISVIAPVTNLLVIWILPFLMMAVLAALFLSSIFPGISFLFFLPSKLLLKYIIITVEFLDKIPYAYLKIDYLWWGWIILYYGIIGWVAWVIKKTNNSAL